jgi:hypothetical protein
MAMRLFALVFIGEFWRGTDRIIIASLAYQRLLYHNKKEIQAVPKNFLDILKNNYIFP